MEEDLRRGETLVSAARRWLLVVLLALPVVLFLAIGTWALWETGHLFWSWWTVPVCWGLAYLLARRWRTQLLPLPDSEPAPPLHWTPQDRQAQEIIEEYRQKVQELPEGTLTELRFYLDTAQDLALKIARHYHPKAKDPVGSLTVPEILAAAHLAVEDLEHWVRETVPGSHLLTVNQWRTLSHAPGWFRTIRDLSWGVSILLNPASAARYLASKTTLDPFAKQMQANLLAAFYTMFVRRVGFYAIEMNSGRLRGGADRYREAMQSPGSEEDEGAARTDGAPAGSAPLTIAVVGRLGAGKSSVITALLGGGPEAGDDSPQTGGVVRHRWNLEGAAGDVTLLDTPGYGAEGALKSQLKEIRKAFDEADLVLLVLKGTDPAREADAALLDTMHEWSESTPGRKPPPVLAVLTHIDALSPDVEWDLPDDYWEGQPANPTAQAIQEAVEGVQHRFADRLRAVVPVCSDVEGDRLYGVAEWLIPAMMALLPEAQACSLVRLLDSELSGGKTRRLLRQVRKAGMSVLRSFVGRGP